MVTINIICAPIKKSRGWPSVRVSIAFYSEWNYTEHSSPMLLEMDHNLHIPMDRRTTMLKKRKLGNQGLEVSELGLGCMGMSQSYGTPNDPESIATIHHAIDLGVTFFDTAEVYGPYTNERLLGSALKGRREHVIVATKFGFNIANGKIEGANSNPKHIKQAVDGSLQRLGLDHIDLLYQHRVDPATPIEDVVGAMRQLVLEGKVRYLGLSEAGVETIRRAHKIHPISALQSEYSLWERNLEERIIPLLKELDIGLVPFSPLGRGFLTGKVQRAEEYPEGDFRRGDPRFQAKNFDANLHIASIINEMAKAKKATPAQIALAWLLHKGQNIVPIPGTKRRSYLEDNLNSTKISLTDAEMKTLNDSLPIAKGDRYNQQLMKMIDR